MYDIARLRAALRAPYELVVCPFARPYVMSVVKAAGQPFAMMLAGATSDRNCVGGIDIDTAGVIWYHIWYLAAVDAARCDLLQ